jgi:hypothetical protein
MALQFIDNQPIIFDSQLDTYSPCKKDNSIQCAYYTDADTLFVQWKQTPCDDTNKLCNADWVNGAPNLITNGTFSGSSTGWTLGANPGCTVTFNATTNAIDWTTPVPGPLPVSSIEQTIAGLTAGTKYEITFTVSNLSSGGVNVNLGGTSYPNNTYANGTYTITATAGGLNSKIVFVFFGGTGTIDNISMKVAFGYYTNGWYPYYNQTDLTYLNGTITHIPGTGNAFGQQVANCTNLNYGGYYKFKIKVTGMTAGKVWLGQLPPDLSCITYCDPSIYLLEITQDGVYEVFTTQTGFMGFWIYFSEDTDATVSEPEAIEYGNFHTLILKNTVNLITYNLTTELEYYQDYITLKYPLTTVSDGCYELCITDACGYSLNDFLTTDPFFVGPLNDPNSWTYIAEYGDIASQTITGGKFKITASTPTGVPYIAWRLKDTALNLTTYPTPLTSATFSWKLVTAKVDKAFKLQLIIPGAATTPFLAQNVQGLSTYQGTVTIQFPAGASSNDYTLRFNTSGYGNIINGDQIEIEYFELQLQSYYPGQSTEYCSQCFTVTSDDDCLMWVGGTNGEDAYGFHFDPNDTVPFQIGSRVESMLINPTYKGELKRYEDAEGNIIVTRGKSGKVYTLFINYSDEHTHDWLRLATLSDTIDINGTYFVGTEGDYEPEWPDNLGNFARAQARVEVQKKVDPLFNNNAG